MSGIAREMCRTGPVSRSQRETHPAGVMGGRTGREPAQAEPLTEREEAVLRLLRGTLSLHEIGQELFLSTNTIKTHTRAIYRKLGVTSRSGAVERGRDIGIL